MAESNKKTVNLLIHAFAVAHALTALLLYATKMGDEVALTVLTIVMIMAVARLYNSPLEVMAGISLLGCFAGFYLGTKGAQILSLIAPDIGRYANVIVTFLVTEALGWVTYMVVKPKRVRR